MPTPNRWALPVAVALLGLGLLGMPAARAQPRQLPLNIEITDSGLPSTQDAFDAEIAAFGASVYAVWSDEREDDNPRIYFARSADGGQTWGANQRLNRLPSDSHLGTPAITVQADGTIWVAWHLYSAGINYPDASDNDIWLARSTDGGATFTSDLLIDGEDGAGDLHTPLLAFDDAAGLLYMLYHLDRTDGPFATWGADVFLLAYNPATGQTRTAQVNDQARSGRRQEGLQLYDGPKMSLSLRDGVICAAWEDRRDRFAIYGSCSTDQGQTFAANVAFSGADARDPQIQLAPGGALYEAHIDRGAPLVLRRSADRGASWGAPSPLAGVAIGTSVLAYDMAADGAGRLALAWVEEGVSLSGSDLFISVSTDQGRRFATLQIDDAQGQNPETADQRHPALLLTAGAPAQALLAWHDNRNVWDRVWFARANLGALAPQRAYLPLLRR